MAPHAGACGAASRPPGRHETIDVEEVEQFCDVCCNIDDRPSAPLMRPAIS